MAEITIINWADGIKEEQLIDLAKVVAVLPAQSWHRAYIDKTRRVIHVQRANELDIPTHLDLPQKHFKHNLCADGGFLTWAIPTESSRRAVVFRRIPRGEFIVTCNLQAQRDFMQAAFTTAFSCEDIGEVNSFGCRNVTMATLVRRASRAAVRAGKLRSQNQRIRVVLRGHNQPVQASAILWSNEIRQRPAKRRLRMKTDMSAHNLKDTMQKLQSS
ncbi:unnamed protein product [Symbiodinium sp. CCMP2592]|nr:unnamed protein product [Symbiodinium sp. CCMP2592]